MTVVWATAAASPRQDIVQMLVRDQPYHVVSAEQFEALGWALPDGGARVKAIADAAPGSAFDPRRLEQLPAGQLGYRARWHQVRYNVYGLDWDITGLHLLPNEPMPNMPTLVFINGGASNWYEFFVDSLNRPGIGQYLAQKIPVMLVTIPGNYRPGGWTEMDYGKRAPAYVLHREIAADEVAVRNAVFTFRVVADGVKKLLASRTSGPLSIIGHSTGGEIQFMLHGSSLKDRLGGRSIGWGTGGPAGLEVMQGFRGEATADDYPDVWSVRPRPAEDYSGGYLGPWNPFWSEEKSRSEIAERWQGLERRRKPQFKQPLQDIEHRSADNLLPHIASQIRRTLAKHNSGVDADQVIADLFSTMRSPHAGYQRMIWTTSRLDTGHWNADPEEARELLIADEFRRNNPQAAIRLLVFDVPMTHYGHIERPKELAGGLLAALEWLYSDLEE